MKIFLAICITLFTILGINYSKAEKSEKKETKNWSVVDSCDKADRGELARGYIKGVGVWTGVDRIGVILQNYKDANKYSEEYLTYSVGSDTPFSGGTGGTGGPHYALLLKAFSEGSLVNLYCQGNNDFSSLWIGQFSAKE